MTLLSCPEKALTFPSLLSCAVYCSLLTYALYAIRCQRVAFTMSAKSQPRRASYEIRDQHLELGAIVIEVSFDESQYVNAGVSSLLDAEKNFQWGRGKKTEETYVSMQRKGFRITKHTGCFAPHERYTMKSGGANERGYQLSFFAKHKFMLAQTDLDERDSISSIVGDSRKQLSHRCHRRWCCRLDHIDVEPRWRNAARNFCKGPMKVDFGDGKGKTRTCGCSLQYHFSGQPELAGNPCLRAWTPSPSKVPLDIGEVCGSPGDVKTTLTATGFPIPYRFTVQAILDERKAQAVKRKERKSAVADAKVPSDLAPLKGKKLARELANLGLVSPDFKLGKQARLVDAETVPFDLLPDPSKLAYVVSGLSDDDFEEPMPRKRKKSS